MRREACLFCKPLSSVLKVKLGNGVISLGFEPGVSISTDEELKKYLLVSVYSIHSARFSLTGKCLCSV